MNEPLVFKDLVGPERELDKDDRRWLAELAPDLDLAASAVHLGASMASQEPEPVLAPQLDGSWRAGRYIGELRRDGRVLEIQPRLGIAQIAAWASAVFNVRIVGDSAEQTSTSTLIAELVAATWRAALVDAARDGLPGFRAPQLHRGGFVRGRLDVEKTIRLRAARVPSVVSVSRPRDLDNPVSRSIVLAEKELSRRIRRPDWSGPRVAELMPRLRGATGARPQLPTRRELERVRYTPITRRYERVAALSWQIARQRGLRSRATAETADALLLDVAELWELFLLHCAKRAFGTSNVTHGTALNQTRSLLQSQKDPSKTMGRLYPDILVGPSDAPRLIIDAKYKPLNDWRGVDREDRYQLVSYLSAYRGAGRPAGVLAYPLFDDAGRTPSAEELGPWREPGGSLVRFARLPITERACIDALKDLARAQREEDHDSGRWALAGP